jgi:hypothetical protein
MDDELIACSCCGKLIPAEDIELAFRRPDVVAVLNETERADRCEDGGDLCVLDGEKFFVRGTIPLHVHGQSETYEIGAWAEVAQADYQRMLALWENEDQSRASPFHGTLANQIPTASDSLGCELEIRLTGSATRPHLFITAEACSIFSEQKLGIPRHRAGEYTDLVRNKGKKAGKYAVVEEGGVDVHTCSCCDLPQRMYSGKIFLRADQVIAWDYWVEIPEGHEGRFCLLISLPEGAAHRIAVLSGEATKDGLTYRVLDREDSPWEDMGGYGRIMDRSEALSEGVKSLIFELTDSIAANDSRLMAHARPYLGIA